MRRALIAFLMGLGVIVTGGVAVAAVSGSQAACTSAPEIVDNGDSQSVTVTCELPKPPPVTETVTVPGPTVTATATATVTETVTATVTATPTPPPSSAPPASSSPTPTATTPPPSNGAFPDGSNTGVPAGTTLTAYTGPSNITAANTVISGKTLGCVQVSAPGVVIRNSRISCAGNAVNVNDRGGPSSGPLLLEDVSIDCKNTGGATAVTEAWVTANRVDISGCENGFDVNQGVTVTDSYIHGLVIGGHEDGIQLAQYWNGTTYATGARNVLIRHNTIFGAGADGSFGTSAIISNRGSGDLNVTIDNNLLGGGAYTLYCPGGVGTNIRVTNNHFTNRFGAKYGAYGPSDSCSDEAIVTGNVTDETGLPLNLS